MIKKKDFLILAMLRQNARSTLTDMSKCTHIPISTLYDKIRQYEEGLIRKYTPIVDFARMGFNTRANISIKVGNEQKEELRDFLTKHNNVNSLYKINNGYDFMAECVFKHVKDLEDFIEHLEEKFKIKQKVVYYIIDDIKREEFLCNPNMLNAMVG